VNNAGEAMRTGYGESKHLAEQLFRAATAKSGVSASVLRIGQIAPVSSTSSHNIVWPAMDSLTVLLRTSKTLQMVPTDLMDIDWLPVDIVVNLILSIMHHDCSAGTEQIRFYNLVNPVTTPWSEVVPSVQNWCGKTITRTTLKEWTETLRNQSQGQNDPQLQPVLRLLSFFEFISERGPAHGYAQENLLKVCGNTVDIRPIDAKVLEVWLAALQ
jgi:thioester reductase-like protein